MTTWEDIVDKKRKSLVDSIPKEWRHPDLRKEMIRAGYVDTAQYLDTILDPKERAITDLSLMELINRLSIGSLSSYEVTKAYCHRAALAHQILNCCSEIFFAKALKRAKALDCSKKSLPLRGVPISFKDQVDLPGIPSAIGFVGLANTPKNDMSLLARKLQDMGAIFYVKTAVPPAMIAGETDSNLIGYTWNARNIHLTCGGSSGGEGALIGAKASPCGFGTDIAGSIRYPSAFQGIYGLKPSTGRFSYMNVTNSCSGQMISPSVIGPMTRSLNDTEFISKLVIGTECWKEDPDVLPLPWADIHQDRFTIGIIEDDGLARPHAPILRAIKNLSSKPEHLGCSIVRIKIPFHQQLFSALEKILSAEAFKELKDCYSLSGEPPVSCVSDEATLKPGQIALNVNEYWDLRNEVYRLKIKFLEYWKDTHIDAIISPVSVSTSFLPGGLKLDNYTSVFNITNCCCVTIPIGKVDKKIDVKRPMNARNDIERKVIESYDPGIFDGMPISIQLVCKSCEEEKLLKIAKIIDGVTTYKFD